MATFLHTMIRVLDLDRSIQFYQQALAFEVTARREFSDFTLVYLGNAECPVELELTLNHGRSEPYTHGSGYGHIAVSVADVVAEYARFKALGFAPRDIVEFKEADELLAKFFFVQDPDGYEIEVLQRLGRYQ
ncbi:VOC family protein [Beggiatoa leptomitoformis]|uniref:Aldoketomutase n=1 Tax=Beggiatoa leptomitoformis TaxID=288004 RepID=A0A2N9YDX2_9GAMM|nr:VOC family protein [Beggiatoa leptomitoformis]ALG68930.1 lactoylglutathione lyase [Beggiatoa leptomitoformis]AUI68688.1 lactoylglutathione lyase [Beggiatoa leptomitoformis]